MIALIQLQILIIAIFVAAACVLPGVFLVLRGVALMSDAISHAILLGIVGMFLITHDLSSPFLIIGAAIAGIVTVICTELLIHTKRLKKDAAIGLIFPLFFSVGVILISQYARNVHLDVDMVLLGEIGFAPFNRLEIMGYDCGPHAMWVMGIILAINALFVFLFYKELQLATFDKNSAYLLGFSPTLLYYGLMTITSITAVGAFDVVGSIVVVALMVTPASAGFLLAKRLPDMLLYSLLIGIISAIAGYVMAMIGDVSIAGSIATMGGILFIGVLLFAPEKGLVARMHAFQKNKMDLMGDLFNKWQKRYGQRQAVEIAHINKWPKGVIERLSLSKNNPK